MDRAVPGIRYLYPRFARDENNGVGTCHGAFIANSYGGTTFFQDNYLFGIVVFVERNHGAGIQNFVSDVEVLGVSVLLVDLNDKFGNGTRTSGSSRRISDVAVNGLPVLAAVDCEP